MYVDQRRQTVLTVSGPVRVMYTCSEYVPGKMKIDLVELSLGKEATAEETVLNSPVVVVPARTTKAPDGGVVRETASTSLDRLARSRMKPAKLNISGRSCEVTELVVVYMLFLEGTGITVGKTDHYTWSVDEGSDHHIIAGAFSNHGSVECRQRKKARGPLVRNEVNVHNVFLAQDAKR